MSSIANLVASIRDRFNAKRNALEMSYAELVQAAARGDRLDAAKAADVIERAGADGDTFAADVARLRFETATTAAADGRRVDASTIAEIAAAHGTDADGFQAAVNRIQYTRQCETEVAAGFPAGERFRDAEAAIAALDEELIEFRKAHETKVAAQEKILAESREVFRLAENARRELKRITEGK